jgi:hypothetical protein
MKPALLGILAVSLLAGAPLRLGPGEYRWLPFTVSRTPTAVDCRFRVLQGGPTVQMEVMTAAAFRRFSHGRGYDPIAAVPDGRNGRIERLIDERGEYMVVVENAEEAPAAMVDLELKTDVNPSPESLARVLSPERRLTVILVSFGIFFAIVTWSGLRLWRAANQR